jgi:hypothetical protein
MAGLVLYAALLPQTIPASSPIRGYNDTTLYEAIADRVRAGEGYYAAAAAEHRANGYPTAPPQVFREPALTWLLALLRFDLARRAAIVALAVVVALAMRTALEREGVRTVPRLIAMVALSTGVAIAGVNRIYFLHEAWAALFIALSLALYRPGRWILPVILGVTVCLFREIAFPYLLAMGAFALWERRWREFAGWAGGAAVFLGLYALHLAQAQALYRPGDLISASWIALGGPRFVLETAHRSIALNLVPPVVVAFAVALGLAGLAGARNAIAARCALIVGGYMAAFLVVGRPDNGYWGLLYAPLLPLGWVAAPFAVRDLVRSALGRPAPPASPDKPKNAPPYLERRERSGRPPRGQFRTAG